MINLHDREVQDLIAWIEECQRNPRKLQEELDNETQLRLDHSHYNSDNPISLDRIYRD